MTNQDNKVAKTLKRVLEYLWLIVAIIALAIAIKETISSSFKNYLIYYGFVLVALFFYFTRRKQRLKN